MSCHSSGCYVIDSDYNIVNANETALSLYPQLTVGKKCYQCLMGLDHPCGPGFDLYRNHGLYREDGTITGT